MTDQGECEMPKLLLSSLIIALINAAGTVIRNKTGEARTCVKMTPFRKQSIK